MKLLSEKCSEVTKNQIVGTVKELTGWSIECSPHQLDFSKPVAVHYKWPQQTRCHEQDAVFECYPDNENELLTDDASSLLREDLLKDFRGHPYYEVELYALCQWLHLKGYLSNDKLWVTT